MPAGHYGPMKEDAPLSFATVTRLRQWLRRKGARDTGAWVLLAKKGTEAGITYHEALEEAGLDRREVPPPRRAILRAVVITAQAPQRLVAGQPGDGGTAEGRGANAAGGPGPGPEAKASGRWQAAYATAAPPRLGVESRRALADAGLLAAWKGSPRPIACSSCIGSARRSGLKRGQGVSRSCPGS